MNPWIVLVLLPLDSRGALYAILVGCIVVSSLGAPIPEEITLLLAGYLSYLGFLPYWTTIAVMTVGVVAGDCVGYVLGRYAGGALYRVGISHVAFARDMFDKGKRAFERFGEKVILISRPIPGLRFVVPILAGHIRMDVKRFLSYDIAAAILWTLFVVTLSYYLGSVFALIADFRALTHIIFWTIAILILIMITRHIIKKRRRKKM